MAFYDKIDTAKKVKLGSTRRVNGNEYIYLKGVASLAIGSWVTYDENGATALLTANAVGPVAVSMAANTSATNFSWFQILGVNTVAKTDTISADKGLYIDATDGRVDDAGVAGDMVFGAVSVSADTSNVASVRLLYPFVNDGAYLT